MASNRRGSSPDPYQNERFINLAAAYLAIEKYLKRHDIKSEKALLVDFQNRIRAIEVAQKGWLKAEHSLLDRKTQRTQAELSRQAAEAEQKKLGFTYITLQKLKQDIKDQLENEAISDSMYHLLKYIDKCAEAVLSNIKENIKLKESDVEAILSKNDQDFFLGQNIMSAHTQVVGGRFLMADQLRDPFRGKEKRGSQEIEFGGACYGYVKTWKDQVEQYGKDTSSLIMDTDTFRHQLDQSSPIAKSLVKYQSVSEISSAVEKLTSQITSDRVIYSLAIHGFSSGIHAVGARIIPGTNEVEITDSDMYKVAVFPSIDHFTVWLKTHMFLFADRAGGALQLYEIGKQFSHSVASIPQSVRPNKVSFSESDIKKFIDDHAKLFFEIRGDYDKTAELAWVLRMRFEVRSHILTYSDKKNINDIDSEFMKFQLKRFERLRGRPLDVNELKKYENNFDKEHVRLKTNVIRKIDEHLEGMGKGNQRIKSILIDLKKRIRNASPSISLSAIVDEWSLRKRNDKTNREILKKDKNSLNFINQLVEDCEVSPIALSFSHEILANKILAMIYQRDWAKYGSSKGLPVAYRQLKNELENLDNLRNLLTEVRHISRENHGNWFWRKKVGQSEAMSDFIASLKDIDLDNPSSLLKAYSDLEKLDARLFGKVSVVEEAAVSPSEAQDLQSRNKFKIENAIELKIDLQLSKDREKLPLTSLRAYPKRRIGDPPPDPIIVEDILSGRFYLLNPFDDPPNPKQFAFFTFSADEYRDYLGQGLITPQIKTDENDVMLTAKAEGLWQVASGLSAEKINVDSNYGLRDIIKDPLNSWNISSQIGFPFGLSVFSDILRARELINTFEKKHGRPPTDVEKNIIYKDSAAFAAKTAMTMGAWELGYFAGQCVITTCSVTPFTFWIPVVLAICAGVSQAIFAVINQVADEKRKFGELKSSVFELAKIFMTNLVAGIVWQCCSYIPFGSLLASSLKTAATLVTNILLGIGSFVSNLVVHKIVPKIMDRARNAYHKVGTFFKSTEDELKPLYFDNKSSYLDEEDDSEAASARRSGRATGG